MGETRQRLTVVADSPTRRSSDLARPKFAKAEPDAASGTRRSFPASDRAS